MKESLLELKKRFYCLKGIVSEQPVSPNDYEQYLFLKMKLARAEKEMFGNVEAVPDIYADDLGMEEVVGYVESISEPVTISYSEPIPTVPEIPVKDLRPKKKSIIRRKLFWMVIIVNAIVLISILLCGCTAGIGVGADASFFYPNIPGKLKDPAESRNQTTQHTTGMARNNLPMVGGD